MIHRALLSVQGDKLLPVHSAVNHNLPLLDPVQIIRVHRLAVLSHHIVCDIDEIIDRADSVRRERSLHPLRRRREVYIFHDARAVTRAEVFCLHLDGNIIRRVLIIARLRHHRGMKRFAECRGRFSCDADDAVAVDPV